MSAQHYGQMQLVKQLSADLVLSLRPEMQVWRTLDWCWHSKVYSLTALCCQAAAPTPQAWPRLRLPWVLQLADPGKSLAQLYSAVTLQVL